MTAFVRFDGARRRLGFRVGLLISASALAGSFSGHANAQTSQAAPPPRYNNIDDLGIDLTTGQPNISFTEGSIGPANGGIAFTKTWTSGAGWTDNWTGGAFRRTVGGISTWYVEHGDRSETFVQSGSSFTNQQGTGSMLAGATGRNLTYTAADGTVTTYTDYNIDDTGYVVGLSSCAGDQGTCLLPSKIVKPNGLTYTYNWRTIARCPNGNAGLDCGGRTYYRLTSITSSAGYQLTFSYSTSSVTGAVPATGWFTRTSAQYSNTMTSCGTSCPSVTYPASTDYVVVDPAGRQWQFSGNSGPISKIRKPGSTSDDVTIAYDANARVSSASIVGLGTWTYSFSDTGTSRTAVVTDPMGHTRTIVSDMTIGRPTSVTNGESKTTTYSYYANGLLQKVAAPEGNYTQYTYDARGNVTEQRQVAKGSGVTDLVSTSGYDGTCSSVAKCNSPNWTKDANGNQTDYTYDLTTGNLLTVQAPAASAGGTRPTTTYSYTTVNGAQMLGGTSTCLVGVNCGGTANELKTSISYNANSLPSTLTRQAGDGSLSTTVSQAYDAVGNVTSTTDALGNMTSYSYAADRHVLGMVGPDPDGSGPRTPGAVQYSYNSHGVVTQTTVGTVPNQATSLSSFSEIAHTSTTLDLDDRPVRTSVVGGSTTYAVTDQIYDAAGRLSCSIQYMNPSAVPGSVATTCALSQTSGPYGPDRVTQATYDADGRVSTVAEGIGTSAQGVTATYGYTNNGKTAYVADGNNNRTSYVYDGFDRMVQTQYPSSSKGTNSSNTGDYEAVLAYDANGNPTQTRLRDGNTIGLTYDNLGRLTSRTVQTNPSYPYDYPVSYSYNLAGQITAISRPGDGNTISYGYDALGRQTSEVQASGTVSYQYDQASRRIRQTWNDGFYVNYDYDNTGLVTAVRENGATSGVGVLASYSYDNAGRRTGVTYGNGTSRSYGYDAISRLTGLQLTFPNASGYNHTIGGLNGTGTAIGYSPASQIASLAKSNDSFAWTRAANADRNYVTNGLNQYTSDGQVSFGYDGRGNLTSSGTQSFGYTKQNEMISGPNGTTIYYDPLSRVSEYDTNVSTRFYYSGAAIAAEIANNGTNAVLRRYVMGPGTDEPIVWYEGSGTSDRRFLQADERGSIIAVTDSGGSMLGVNSYDEYGIPGLNNMGRFQYTGQAWYGEVGLYNFKARWYSPSLGRFMQTDPIGYGDGLNWHNYVGSDPINAVDPSGLDKCKDGSNDICVYGHKQKVKNSNGGGYVASPNPVGNGGSSGLGGSIRSTALDKDSKQQSAPFTCAEAAKQPGKIQATGVSGTITGLIGWTATKGTWKNLQTGATGSFTTVGFTAGLAAGASVGRQTYSSMDAFTGMSDGYTVGGSFGIGPVGVGGSYSSSWNDSGSGSGGNFDVGSAALPFLGFAASYTETNISNCRAGGK